MKSRSAELRERNRRVLRWSFGAALVIHVAAFLLWPETPVAPFAEASGSVVKAVEEGTPWTRVDVEFGPPRIVMAGGRAVDEATDPTPLEASRLVRLPADCWGRVVQGSEPIPGRIRLVVNEEGRVDESRIVEGSGDPCLDEAMLSVAGDLWYRWLPDERWPAPVDLIQPVTLTRVE